MQQKTATTHHAKEVATRRLTFSDFMGVLISERKSFFQLFSLVCQIPGDVSRVSHTPKELQSPERASRRAFFPSTIKIAFGYASQGFAVSS